MTASENPKLLLKINRQSVMFYCSAHVEDNIPNINIQENIIEYHCVIGQLSTKRNLLPYQSKAINLSY